MKPRVSTQKNITVLKNQILESRSSMNSFCAVWYRCTTQCRLDGRNSGLSSNGRPSAPAGAQSVTYRVPFRAPASRSYTSDSIECPMSSNCSVESLPACRKSTLAPPGCFFRKPVMSYTFPWITVQQSVLVLCLPTSSMVIRGSPMMLQYGKRAAAK